MHDSQEPSRSKKEEHAGILSDISDPVIDAYKRDIDRTLLRCNLELTVEERFLKFEQFMAYVHELRQAGQRKRNSAESDIPDQR